MALPAGFVIDKPEKVKLPSGFALDSDKAGLASLAKPEPREAPAYDPLGQVIGDIPAPLDYQVEGQGRMNEPGALTTLSDLVKQFIAPGVKAPFALPQATETAVKGFARQAMEGTPEAIMPSSVFQPGLDTEETLFGPETDVQKARRKLQAQRAVAAMPSIPGAAALNKIGENVQKDILGSLSPEAKKALQESQITGNIFKGEVDFGTNPNAYGYALQAANVFGSMAPVIATAMVTKSPGAGGFVGGTMAADEAATSAAEFINKIPDAELRQKSPFYAELIAGGASPKEARALTIKKAAESGAALQGLVATFGDVLTGKLVTGAFDKTIAKLGTNRLARAGGVGAASSLEEAIQETGEGLSSDVTLKNLIPSKELGEDSAANFILGALGGAGPGVIKGALSEAEAKAPEREKYVQPEGGLAEIIARQKGFLRPEGGAPAAPVAQAPVPPAPPAAPVVAPPSDAMDTEAMLAELIDSINPPKEAPTISVKEVELTPNLQEKAAAEEKLAEAPATVKVYRGHRIGEEFKSADDGNLGAGFYTTESEQAAKEFASRNKNGTVLQGELKASRILDMDKLSKEDIANLKRAIPNTAQELQEYGIPYYDDATNELVTEDLQKIHSNLNRGGFEPRKLSDALPQGYTEALGAIYNEAGYDAITRTGDALKSGTKYKEYVTFSPESQNLLTPKAEQAPEELAPDEAFGITGGKVPEPEEFTEAKRRVDESVKAVNKMRAKPGSLWGQLTGALNPEEVREIFGPNPNLGQRKLQVIQGGGNGAYVVDLVDDGILDGFLPPNMRHDSNTFDATESAQYIKDAIGNKDYLPFDAKMEVEMIFNSVAEAEELIQEYLTIEEQNRELQIAADEQREADQEVETVKPEDKDRPAETGEREPLELTAPTADEIRTKQADTERRAKEEERTQKAAEDKARADEQAAEFTLTGSDRTADVAAARGQKDIFTEAPKPQTEQERTVSMPKKEFREDKETRGKSDHPALKMVFKGETPKSLIAKYGEKDVRFLGRLFNIDVKDKFNVAKKLIAIDSGLSLVRGKDKAYFDKMNKAQLGEFLEAVGQSAYGQKYQLVERLLKHEGNVMGKFNDNLQDLKHRAAIINEARAKKPISEEVLKDYPDVAAYSLPRESDGYKAAIRTLSMRALPSLGMDIPSAVEAYREDAKTTKDPVEKYVAADIADGMEEYYNTQFKKKSEISARLAEGKEPTMGEMIAEGKRVKAQLAALEKAEKEPKVKEEPAEVLPAEEPQIAGQVGFEPYTIEGDFTEVAEEQQRLMLEDQTENLSDDQVSTLEKHYGAKADSDEFFTKLREDVSNFIVKGATAVNGKIRAIIRQLANGVLAVGIAFNPQYMSQPINVFMPVDNVRTEEVLAQVPDAATDKMSEPAKRAFAVIYPALQEQMVAKDKLFIMADKPSGRVFVFNPDGSLLLEKKSLFGLAKGDLYVGDNDKPQNRITPAGLFDLKFVDAAKGEAQKRTAGDYDTGTVLAINDPDGTITIMHSVWLKEKDAAQRAAALRNDSPADSRYSFGCINVDAPTYKFLVDNHAQQMDGAALFIVPEAGVDVMSFITGKGAMSEDLARIKIKPVTKEVRTPQRQATQAEAKTKTPGREQQFFSLEKQTGTPAFKKFFGDSKVVDADGNPLVVYHGTIVRPDTEGVKGMGDIMAFDRMFTTQFRKPSIDTVGSFFSTNPGEGGAQMYSGTGEGAAVYPVYLSIKNPYTTTFETMLRRARMMENGVDDGRKIGAKEVAALRKFLKETGKDGIHIKADPKSAEFKDQDVWIALEPEQIKSATGNIGTFDESANINMNLGDALVNMVNSMADDMAEDEKKRSPSLKRQVKTYNRQRKDGKMSDEMFVMMADSAIREDEERRMAEEPKPRKRGYLHIQNRLNEAVQAKDISREAYDLANWFMLQNEDLVADLGVSIKAKGQAGAGGFYNNLSRVFTLIKGASSDVTATHEILHHLERMMPTKIQQGIRKAWLSQLTKAAKATKDPVQKLYFEAVIDANIGDNRHAMVNVPEGAGKAYSNARMAMEDMAGGNTSTKLAEVLLLQGAVPMDMYQYFNPSEFWAVNGTRIVEGRYEAVKGGTLTKLKNWLRDLGQTIKSLFGLKSDASIIRALDSLAKSDGKFVTDEMLGAGQEYKSIQRRNYEGGEAPEPDMEIPEMSFMDDVIYKYGDKLIDTKRLIQSIKSTGKKLNEQFDAYMKEENYHGRLAKRTDSFLNDEMRPVLVEMQEKNVTLDELETFLLNRHAKEANAYIAKINPTGFPEAGSSVSDADADAYMKALTPEKRKDLTALAAKVDAIVKETQRVLVANGLETQDTIDEWNKTYKNYVPLMRDQLDFVHTGRGVMGGFATRGSASKRRVGSDKPVIDIFANIAMQRERALRRSEQARVGRALYGMAIKHPNPGFWLAINPDAIKDKDKLEAELISLGLTPEDARNIIQEPRQPMFDKKTGTVKYQVNPLLRNSPNVFPVRINGEDRFIFFNPNDPRALRMVESIKNLDTERLGDAIGMAGMVTRWFASVNTQYNIVFGGVNFLRDLGAASLNLSTTEIAGKEKEVRANVLPALRAIYRDLRGKGATTEAMAEMQDWFERFQLAGGQTGYQNQFAETKRKGNVVEQELKRLNRGNVKKAVDSVFDWLSDYNDAIENAVRLSAFKVAVEQGLSEDKAASIAKNLTVNFNRKGSRTGLISALYAFFNAAIQGSARMVETLRGPMGKKIIFGGMFLGSMQAIALAMAGFDDDEPPEFVKDKNLIIPIPYSDKKYLSIPMPLGFNMFPGFGRLAMETLLIETGMIRSRKGPGDKVMSAVSLVFDAFNPLGGAGNPLLMAMPTILDPFAAIYSNRDAFGRPIYREDKGNAPTPGYERSRENSSLFSKKLAEAINWATSPAGTQHTKGFFSPTADQIDYFIGQVTGGVGREIMKIGEFAKSKAVTQEEVPAYKLPIVGRFYGEAESPAATRSRFYENVKEMAKHEYEIKGLRKDKVSPTEYVKANPEARLWQRANNVENQIVKLNKEKRTLIEKDAPREAVKRKEDEILRKMTEFNNQVRRGQ